MPLHTHDTTPLAQKCLAACADPESFVRGPILTLLFFFVGGGVVDERREDLNTTKAGHHRPASETPFNAGLVAL